ncbi:hypothetical protein GQ457_07G011040 [Hibiscus cannabinus]
MSQSNLVLDQGIGSISDGENIHTKEKEKMDTTNQALLQMDTSPEEEGSYPIPQDINEMDPDILESQDIRDLSATNFSDKIATDRFKEREEVNGTKYGKMDQSALATPTFDHDIGSQLCDSLQGCNVTGKPGTVESEDMRQLLAEFDKVFVSPHGLPPTREIDHAIHLQPMRKPINFRPYRYPYFHKGEIERQVRHMLEQQLIRKSNSPFSFPVLLVKKKDGTWQFCVDYHALNAVTIKDKFPIPTAEELFDELGHSKFFSKLDLLAGYHQIRVKTEDVPKTTFRTHEGHYEFLVLPKLQANGFVAKRSKCTFGQTTIEYLGHIVSQKGLAVDSTKVKTIQAWPIPTTLKEVRGFLGVASYYHSSKFHNQLKTCICSTPVLGLPNFDKEFHIETDASGIGIRVVLTQEDKPLACFSQKLSTRMQGASGRCLPLHRPWESGINIWWLSKLIEYDFEIRYRPGKLNNVADALSRKNEATLMAFSRPLFGGHAGITRTFQRLAANFYWKGMRKEVRQFVTECQVCQRMKSASLSPAGLLQPLPIPDQVFEDISLDFIVGLPKSNGKEIIMVIVDRLTKYTQIMVHGIVKLHGIPRTIVSDRDRIFISDMWIEIAKLQGTELCFSSAYHPQTDGQTKALNRCLEMYLPLYGHEPHTVLNYLEGSSHNAQVDHDLKERDALLRVLKDNLVQAQVRMKNQADKHRRELELKEGSWAFVRLQPYRHLSLRFQKHHKLGPRFFGPYRIIKRIGQVAYKLELSDSTRIHPMFHVSQLKPCKGQPLQQITPLPLLMDDFCLPTSIENLEDKDEDVTIEEVGNQETLWHARLGHPSRQRMRFFTALNSKIPVCNNTDCTVCHLAKHKRLPFPVSQSVSDYCFDLVHIDTWGPFPVKSLYGHSYFLTIVDDKSRYLWIYPMHKKSEARSLIIDFFQMVETQFCAKVKCIRTDNAKEFDILDFYKAKGIQHQNSCVHTPQQNSVVERKHQHILSVARALRIQASLPLVFWIDYILHAAYLINPCLDHLKIFGSLAYASVLPKSKTKLHSRAHQCVFLGYPKNIKGYRLYDLQNRNVFVSRDVIFCEDTFPFQKDIDKFVVLPACENQYFIEESLVKNVHKNNLPQVSEIPVRQHVTSNDLSGSSELSVIPEGVDNSVTNPKHIDDTSCELLNASEQASAQRNSITVVDRPARSRKLPQHLSDYQVDISKVRKSSHTVAQVMSYQNLSDNHLSYINNVEILSEPKSYKQAVTCELQWLTYLLSDLHIKLPSATLYCDNLPAIKIAENLVYHERTKHIEIDCHLVREKLQQKMLVLLPIRALHVKSSKTHLGSHPSDADLSPSQLCRLLGVFLRFGSVGRRDRSPTQPSSSRYAQPHEPVITGSSTVVECDPDTR